jgi:hypothetical protein
MLALNYLLVRSMNNRKIEAPNTLLEQKIEYDIDHSWQNYLKDSLNSV